MANSSTHILPEGQRREYHLKIGREAVDYARKHIAKSPTFMRLSLLANPAPINPVDVKDTIAELANLISAVNTMRNSALTLQDSLKMLYHIPNPLQEIRPSINLKRIKSSANKVGNCGEYRTLVGQYLLKHYPQVRVESMRIIGIDHTFIVMGRKIPSDINNPDDWGPDAVLVDAWENKVYPATIANLQAHLYRTDPNFQYDPAKHKFAAQTISELTHETDPEYKTQISNLYNEALTQLEVMKHALKEMADHYHLDMSATIKSCNLSQQNIITMRDKAKFSTLAPAYLGYALTKIVTKHMRIPPVTAKAPQLQKVLDESLLQVWLQRTFASDHYLLQENHLHNLFYLIMYANREISLRICINWLQNPKISPYFQIVLVEEAKNINHNFLKILLERDDVAYIKSLCSFLDKPTLNKLVNNNVWLALIKKKNTAMMQLFLSKGLSANNIANHSGRTALHMAARMNDETMVQILLNAGADPTLTDTKGKKPQDLSTSKTITNILKIAENQAWLNHFGGIRFFNTQDEAKDTPLDQPARSKPPRKRTTPQ